MKTIYKTMKTKLILLLAVTALLSFTSDKEIKDYLNVKTLKFNGKDYDLKWSSKNGNYYIQEYLTNDDSLPDFKEMVSLFVLNENVSIEDAVAMKVIELEEVKKTDPVCNYAITESKSDQTVLVDFLRSESEGDYTRIIEFNLYRYKQIKIGKNKKAVLLFAFSKRAYWADTSPFLRSLVEARTELMNKVLQCEMPEIKLME